MKFLSIFGILTSSMPLKSKLIKKNLLSILLSMSLGMLSNVLFAQTLSVRYPHNEVINWGKWGQEDEKGAGNYITAIEQSRCYSFPYKPHSN